MRPPSAGVGPFLCLKESSFALSALDIHQGSPFHIVRELLGASDVRRIVTHMYGFNLGEKRGSGSG